METTKATRRAIRLAGCAVMLLSFLPGPVGAQHARPQPVRVEIDLLPDDPDNVVDPLHPGKVPVAIMGAPSFDPRSIDPASLRLQGAPISKRDDGSLALFEDVNGDGRTDLLALFPEEALRTGLESARAELTGTTLSGLRIAGDDRFETIGAIRLRTRGGDKPGRVKGAAVPVVIDVLPGEPDNRIGAEDGDAVTVAILSGPGFDATAVDPASVDLAGAPITRARRGRWAESSDVNGDGCPDLMVSVARKALRLAATTGAQPLLLRAMTRDGRTIEGRDVVRAPLTRTSTWSSGAAPSPESANSGGITINDNAPATPYPSQIVIPAGPPNQFISKVRVSLRGLSHTFPADLDILLVGPEGQSVVLMSDAGGGNPGVAGITLTFDDDAGEYLSLVAPPISGVYRPTDYSSGPTDLYPAPAPVPSSAPGLAVFNSTHPAGVWSLYVVDDELGDVGTIASGWSLEIVTMEQECVGIGNGLDAIGDPGKMTFYYPIQIPFSSPGVVSKATLGLQLRHPSPADLDILVESPTGETALVMSDAGGTSPPGLVIVRLDDDAFTTIPESSLSGGAFRSFNYDDGIADILAAPAPAGPYHSTLSSLRGAGVAGTWKVYVVDDTFTGTPGSLFNVCLGLVSVAPSANASTGPITIPQGAPAVTEGVAAPYPSTIVVSGAMGTISKVTVEVVGLTHTYPDDLDLLLTGPQGQSLLLMSDAGGPSPVAGVGLVFDDAAAAIPPDDAPALVSGIYRPVDYDPTTDAFPPPAPLPPTGSQLSVFNGTDPNGRWSLYVLDDASGDIGSITGWRLNLTTLLPPESFCTASSTIIPAGAPGITSGPAAPYPSTIDVRGLEMPIGKVRVTLRQLSHTFPDDLDVLLVGPRGQNIVLMSDAGAGLDVNGATFTFDDEAAALLPDEGQLIPGSFRTSNYDGGDGDPFPAPAPAPSNATSLIGTFAGTDPNGTWSLYILDDASADAGTLAFGWCLEIAPLFRPIEAARTFGIYAFEFANQSTVDWYDMVSDTSLSNIAQYNLYRGTPSGQASLLNANPDSCLRATAPAFPITGISETPPLGSFYWYLLVGANVAEELGSAGFAHTALGEEAHVLDSTGPCP